MTLAEAGEWSLPFRQLVGLLLADWSGFHEWTVYVGILPLMLAMVGCTRSAQQAGWAELACLPFLFLALVLAPLFSLGTNGPLFPLLFRVVPGLSFLRVPPRAWFIVAFATACLCAFGVEAMMRRRAAARLGDADGRGAGGVCADVWPGRICCVAGATRRLRRHALRCCTWGLVVPASVAVLLAARTGAHRRARVCRAVGRGHCGDALAGRLVVLSRCAGSAGVCRSRRRGRVAGAKEQPGPFRVYSPSYSLPQHVAQRAGLELADGVDPMQVASYAD